MVITGDFNVGETTDREGFMAAQAESPALRRRPGEKRWAGALSSATELTADLPTHWHRGTRQATVIDKLFISVPKWALCQGWQSTSILGEPQENFIKEISDHSLLMTELASRRPTPRDAAHPAPIAPAVCKHAKYKEYLQAYVLTLPLQDMAPPDQYAMHTVAMQAAAKDTQTFLLRNHGRSQESLAMIFRQMGRSVNRSWRGLAPTLMANHPWTKDFISILEGQVSLVDHANFQSEFDLAQQRARRSVQDPS